MQTDKAGIGEDAVSVVVQDATIYMPLAELVDFAKEIERLEKEKTKLEKEVDFSMGICYYNTRLERQGKTY